MDVTGRHNGGHSDSRVSTWHPPRASSGDVFINVYVYRCADLRLKIQTTTDGEYAIAKRDVDQLRAELGQPSLPNLHETLEERKRESVVSRLQIFCVLSDVPAIALCTSNSLLTITP